MKKIKAVVVDMEGTVFRKTYRFDFIREAFPDHWRNLCLCHGEENLAAKEFSSAWTLLCDLLGPEASKINQANWGKWTNGGYPGYSEWVIDTIRIHKNFGLTRELVDAVVEASAVYFPGAEETFRALKERGITIALVSGGLKAMADRVALDFGLEHCFASAEYYWHDDGTIRHWNCQPSDFVHKKGLVKLLLHDLGISKEECAFIGDGRNDRDVAQYVGLSIGFNPKPYHKFWWDVVIEQAKGKENLEAVLGPLGIISDRHDRGRGLLPITLKPTTEITFKQALLESKTAEIVIYYKDGRIQRRKWDANRFKETSDVMGNLRSRPEFRKDVWKNSGIDRVEVEVISNLKVPEFSGGHPCPAD